MLFQLQFFRSLHSHFIQVLEQLVTLFLLLDVELFNQILSVVHSIQGEPLLINGIDYFVEFVELILNRLGYLLLRHQIQEVIILVVFFLRSLLPIFNFLSFKYFAEVFVDENLHINHLLCNIVYRMQSV